MIGSLQQLYDAGIGPFGTGEPKPEERPALAEP